MQLDLVGFEASEYPPYARPHRLEYKKQKIPDFRSGILSDGV